MPGSSCFLALILPLILRSPRLRASRRMGRGPLVRDAPTGPREARPDDKLRRAPHHEGLAGSRSRDPVARAVGKTYAAPQPKPKRPKEMPAPLDPVIAQIIPLLPLRDPRIM